ncbi:MAG: monofunctional biosynthetic peptidoglycan transglycosylase [Sedimenticolaceae bacterium]
MRGLQKGLVGLLKRLRRWLLLLLLACVFGSVGMVLALRWIDPPYSAVILQRLASEGAPQRQEWVDLDEVAPDMALAVVAAEDQRFPDHHGFDTEEIIAAVERHLDGGPLRGASTISQQVARNLFLWQGRSYLRKGLEVWFTGLLELFWPKRRILEMYLNFAEMGDRTFGVAAAGRRYFGTSPDRLSPAQAALIAAVLPNPVAYRVDAPSAYVRKRRDWILQQMKNLDGPASLAGILRER